MLQTKLDRAYSLVLGLSVIVVAGTLLLTARPALAQAAADKPPEKPKGWESVASLGVTLTSGNSENFLATLGFNTARKWPKDEVLFGASAGYGKTKDKTTDPEVETTSDQYAKGFGQWNHLFSERLYAGLRLDGIYDHVAGIDYRATLSPLVGYYFVKTPKTFLAGEVGPSFIAENLAGEEATQYIGLRVGERFEHKLSDRAKIWQTAEWIPQISDFDNWLLTVEIGISAALSKSLDLRIVLQDQYDNQPALKSNGDYREKNDLKLIAGIGYKF